MEAAEIKRKKLPVQIVVAPDVKAAIEDESTRLSRSENRKITEGEVVQRAFRMYKDSLVPKLEAVIPDPIGRYTNSEREWLRDFMLVGMTALDVAKGVILGKVAADAGEHTLDEGLEAAGATEAKIRGAAKELGRSMQDDSGPRKEDRRHRQKNKPADSEHPEIEPPGKRAG